MRSPSTPGGRGRGGEAPRHYTPAAMGRLISLNGAVKSFGARTVLDGLDLEVDEGARIGVVGQNGSGKSTLLRILAGLDDPDNGAPARRRGLTAAYLPQLVGAEERTPDAYASIDAVVDKLQKQIKRFKGKLMHRPRSPEEAALKPATMMAEPAAEEEVEEDTGALEAPEEEADSHPRLVRTKRFAVKPMNAEEAALQMELLHHDFFVFLNAETGQVNVVYQRRDGDYGLIEPEF